MFLSVDLLLGKIITFYDHLLIISALRYSTDTPAGSFCVHCNDSDIDSRRQLNKFSYAGRTGHANVEKSRTSNASAWLNQ